MLWKTLVATIPTSWSIADLGSMFVAAGLSDLLLREEIRKIHAGPIASPIATLADLKGKAIIAASSKGAFLDRGRLAEVQEAGHHAPFPPRTSVATGPGMAVPRGQPGISQLGSSAYGNCVCSSAPVTAESTTPRGPKWNDLSSFMSDTPRGWSPIKRSTRHGWRHQRSGGQRTEQSGYRLTLKGMTWNWIVWSGTTGIARGVGAGKTGTGQTNWRRIESGSLRDSQWPSGFS